MHSSKLVQFETTKHTASALKRRIAARDLSAVEVLDAFLERTETLNPSLNAVCTLNPRAREEAAAVDAYLAQGNPPRALEGVPFVAKDNLDTAGLRTTFGTEHMRDRVPTKDALSVARLRAAGAVLLGKSNTPEFAADINTTNSIFGQTRNPWDLNTTPGGSSGGTAAAIAAGLVPMGLGTDLGGSIRIPASFTGICGLRPSPGRVPVMSEDFAWETLVPHVQGPMARSVEDLGLMLSVLAGPDSRDPISLPVQSIDYAAAGTVESVPARLSVAFVGDLNGLVPVENEVMEIVKRATAALGDLGAVISQRSLDASDLPQIIAGTRAFNIVARFQGIAEEHGETLGTAITNQLNGAAKFDVRAVTEAERLRTAYWHRTRKLMADCDCLVLPTVGVPAFRLDAALPTEINGKPVANFYDTILSTYAFSVLGLPVINVPAGFTAKGLPVGMQIVGHRHREDTILAIGAAYSQAYSGPFERFPDIDPEQLRPVGEAFMTGGVPVQR
jgi:amidase